ncbi:STAS/SEC14 domain-containing protein [Parasphingopyxis sp. CP4]|uniref:STAS/SEC14 domain-containing protein n=1 Tax=Parasphingopyxis sp. CP4 TaxID=2724527 RepID=UPI0015A2B8AB|nr:STAS/SEC14 domain-containing protein [Parasphingopyxis sp. CP4]QLC23055.1 STAS/SEC14 domain-containing protein [Parasphingopyxis sp. CP4]
MLNFLPSDDTVIAVQVSGHVSHKEMNALMEKLEYAVENNDETHFYCEIADYEGFETDGFTLIMSRGWQLVGKREKLGRIAVVTDTSWLRWAARIESALLPGISYETFTMDERDQALAWAKGETELPHRAAFSIIETNNPDVLGFELSGKISAAEMDALSEHFNEMLENDQPKRLLGRFKNYAGFSPAGIVDEDFWAMKRGMIRTLNRYAVVGAPPWMATMIEALDPLFRVEIRAFDADKEAEAWEWLEAEPAAEHGLAA